MKSIDDKVVLEQLIKVTKDSRAEVYSREIPGYLEITMYWNQFDEKYALQKRIACGVFYQKDEVVSHTLDRMFKEIEYEVGRINYEKG